MTPQEALAQALHEAGIRCQPNIPKCRGVKSHMRHAVAILDALRENGHDIGVMVDEDWEADIRQKERKRLREKTRAVRDADQFALKGVSYDWVLDRLLADPDKADHEHNVSDMLGFCPKCGKADEETP